MPRLQKTALFFLIFLSIAIFSFDIGGSIEISLSRNIYDRGETLIARLDADFLRAPASGDVFFYREHVLVNVIYGAVFSNNTFFIYAITPDTARNYTIVVKNARYRENGIAKESDIQKAFAVSPEKAEFYVNPGFILAENEFRIRATNKKENSISIKASFQGSRQNVSLPPLGYKTISFSAGSISEFALLYLSLEGEKTSYSVPVIVYPHAVNQPDNLTITNETNVTSNAANASAANETNISDANVSIPPAANTSTNASADVFVSPGISVMHQAQEALKFNPDSIRGLSLIREQLPLALPFSIMNLHTETIADISLSYDKELEGIISLWPGFIESIESASSQNLELAINKIDKEGFFNGSIYASSGNFSAIFYFEISVTKDYSNLDSLEIATEETCNADYETLCQSNEFCANATGRYTAEGLCCPEEGICKEAEQEKPKSSSGKLIGFIILLVVIIIGILLFLKFKKTQKKEIGDVYKRAEEGVKEPKAG